MLMLCPEYGECINLDVNAFQLSLIMQLSLAPLLEQPSDKLTDRQVHWVERLMPFVQYMSIIYRKRSMNEADDVSRRPDFFHPDDVHLRRSVEMFALWWDGKLPYLCYQSNDIALLLLSTDAVSVDDDFLTKLKTAYSSRSYCFDEQT